MVVRKYEDELQFIERIDDTSWRIKKGFQVSCNTAKFHFAGFRLKLLLRSQI